MTLVVEYKFRLYKIRLRFAIKWIDFNIGLEEYLKQLQRFGFGPHKGGRVYEINVEFIATE